MNTNNFNVIINFFKHFKHCATVNKKNIYNLQLSLKYSKKPKKINIMASAKTIKDFGYVFNSDGRLRKLNESGEPSIDPFQFNVSDNHQECQRHYEDLGEAITEYVYQLLEEEKLMKLPVPQESNSENGSFIFVSKDYDKKDKLMVFIHGSGVVRAGQWSRSLIINDCINSGTQIPYIRKAVERNFGVIVLNPNDNFRNEKDIPKSGSPEEHGRYVWENYIMKSKASSVVIVAHSYGGVVTLDLANKYSKQFEDKVKAVAFTDSVHSFSNLKVTSTLKKIARNWVASKDSLDKAEKTLDHDVARVSAGHTKHEMTSYSCIESVFRFIDEKLQLTFTKL